MANKIIQTRIKNRFDELSNWQKAGVELLHGEIALVQVPTGNTYVNPVTGKSEPEIELLMKVGKNGTDNKPIAFSSLPWLSAKAADVYGWAKKQTAAEVPISVGTGENTKSTTLGELFTVVNDHTTSISDINDQLDALNGENGEGSIAERITAAIAALDQTNEDPAAGSNVIVKTVTQTDGRVTVTYGSITNDELPNDISASKIIVDDKSTTLAKKLDDLDEALAAIPENFSVTSSGSGVVKSISYDDNYQFTVTKSAVATDEIADSAVTTGKIANLNVTTEKIAAGAVTNEKIDSVAAAKVIVDTDETLPDRLSDIDSEIKGIKESIASGVHFRGITTTTIADNSNSNTITLIKVENGKETNVSYNAEEGDVVIYRDSKNVTEREFIWTGSFWEELGDLTRIGALETTIANLDYAGGSFGTSTNHKFATKVSQENGLIAVDYRQPDATDISYTPAESAATTVHAALEDHRVSLSNIGDILDGVDKVTNYVASEIAKLDVDEPTASGNSTSFIATAKQVDGKIVVTKANLPNASASNAGIVTLSDATNSENGAANSVAATPKAVKTAYDKADDAQIRVADVESDYVRFANDKLYVGKDGADIIIFDCGGAQ